MSKDMRPHHEHGRTNKDDSEGASPASTASMKEPADAIACVALIVLTCTAWCIANDKWTASGWGYPSTYADPAYSDFLGACAPIKAQSEGHLTPFGWKRIPDLAAPDISHWSLSPTPDELVYCLFGSLCGAFGLFPGFHLGVLLGHVVAAMTFYLVARRWLAAAPLWACIGSLAFGLAPYLFAESPHHVTCEYVWHLPVLPIVWGCVATAPGLRMGSRRMWQAIAAACVTGLLNPYFTYVFCQLTLLGGAVFAWHKRSWRAILPAVAVVGMAAAAFFLSELDTVTYRMAHPDAVSGPLVAQREYRWMDIYGFKVIDMFIPSFTHHSEALAGFGLAHRQASVLNDEEGCAYLGLLGIGCLLWLVAVTARALLDGKLASVPIQAWWVLWIVLFFNTGGLNAMIAAFTGFTLFRTATRYSVVVLVIVLLWAAQRLSAWQREAATKYPADVLKIGTLTAAIAACVLILWDQVPRGPTAEKTALIRKLVDSDREFVGKLESALPDRAMVSQLPVMDGTPQPGVVSRVPTAAIAIAR